MGTEGQHGSELDCDEALHRLYHFLDGELTPSRRAEIEEHLNGCSPCVDMYGFEAELRRVIACKCQESVPMELRERIALAIRHEHVKSAPSQ